jgi:hypothetical protein
MMISSCFTNLSLIFFPILYIKHSLLMPGKVRSANDDIHQTGMLFISGALRFVPPFPNTLSFHYEHPVFFLLPGVRNEKVVRNVVFPLYRLSFFLYFYKYLSISDQPSISYNMDSFLQRILPKTIIVRFFFLLKIFEEIFFYLD